MELSPERLWQACLAFEVVLLFISMFNRKSVLLHLGIIAAAVGVVFGPGPLEDAGAYLQTAAFLVGIYAAAQIIVARKA